MVDERLLSRMSVKHWLILGLVIEKPSYGYEIQQRYIRRFNWFLRNSSNDVYRVLTFIEERGFIAHAYTIDERARLGPRGKRAHVEATLNGVEAFRHWLVTPIRLQHWRIEILARIGVGRSLGISGLRALLTTYLSHARAELQEIQNNLITAAPNDMTSLTLALLLEQRRLSTLADCRWATYAGREIDQFTISDDQHE